MMPYFGAWLIQYTFTYEENHYLTKYYAVKIKVTGLEWQVSERINVRAIQQIQNLNWSQCSIKHFNVQIKNLTSFCRYFCFSCAWDFLHVLAVPTCQRGQWRGRRCRWRMQRCDRLQTHSRLQQPEVPGWWPALPSFPYPCEVPLLKKTFNNWVNFIWKSSRTNDKLNRSKN